MSKSTEMPMKPDLSSSETDATEALRRANRQADERAAPSSKILEDDIQQNALLVPAVERRKLYDLAPSRKRPRRTPTRTRHRSTSTARSVPPPPGSSASTSSAPLSIEAAATETVAGPRRRI